MSDQPQVDIEQPKPPEPQPQPERISEPPEPVAPLETAAEHQARKKADASRRIQELLGERKALRLQNAELTERVDRLQQELRDQQAKIEALQSKIALTPDPEQVERAIRQRLRESSIHPAWRSA